MLSIDSLAKSKNNSAVESFTAKLSVLSLLDESSRDIEDYKALAKVAEEQANYKIIGFKIPRLDSSKSDRTDNFAVKLSTAELFSC